MRRTDLTSTLNFLLISNFTYCKFSPEIYHIKRCYWKLSSNTLVSMSAERVFGNELQDSTENQGLEVLNSRKKPKETRENIYDRLQSVYEGEFCKFNFVLSLLF